MAQTDYNRIRDLIRADIVHDRLKGGSRLKVRELALRYETSAIPVREALQQLQGEGIVRFIPNRGASVRTVDTDFVRDIYEIRAMVEPFLARWFVRHQKDGDLDQLEAIQRAFDAAVEVRDWPALRDLNADFHAILYNGHYNDEAVQLAARHTELIAALADRFPRFSARALAVSREHWAIIAAVREQDEDGTAKLVETHVRRSGEHLIERMLASLRHPSEKGADR